MDKLILIEHPTQIRIVSQVQIRIAPAVFSNEKVFCMGGWVDYKNCRFLSEQEAEALKQTNPFQIPSRLIKEYADLKFQKP